MHHGLGQIVMRKTPFFDTYTQWTHEQDCACCHLRKVRLSNSAYPLILENGWKYAQPDSAFQLTLIQPEKAQCDTGFQVTMAEMQAQLKYLSNMYGYSPPIWVYRKFETFDNHRFIVLGYEIPHHDRYNGQNVQQLLAITSIKGEKITLDFSCRAQDCGNFLRRSHWLLEQMKIREREE